MSTIGRGALGWLAASWIAFGGLGILTTTASLGEGSTSSPGWPLTIVVSVAMILAGSGILMRRSWATWLAVAAVAGGLAEAIAWLMWTWTPILVATAVFHIYGLIVLLVAGIPSVRARHDDEPTAAGRRLPG